MPEPSEDRPRLWPAWTPNIPGSLPDLARYVAVDALDDVQFGPDPSAGQSVEPTPERRMLELLYARLARQLIDFWRERWHPGAGQLIRHPWLLVNGRAGTCLDFATTYASMCLAASIPPLLALTEHDGEHHALVVATPDRDMPLVSPYGTATGISKVSDVAAFGRELADGTLVAVDQWRRVGEGSPAFAAASTSGTEYLRGVLEGGGSVWLVDVAWLQSNGHPPLAPPVTRAPVRRFIPGGRTAFDRYESHAALFSELGHASGTVVLLGESGTGKSTLARELAYRAQFGAGWFLTASEPQALINSLYQAERAERPSAVEAREHLDREGYAATALARLNESEDEWVVVLDNADGDPGKLSAWLPRPNHGRPAGVRQLVVITTTKREWAKRHEFDLRRLTPVSDQEAAAFLPGPELVPLVEGRPLLFDAFARLAKTTGWSGAEIAAHQLPEGAVARELRGPACLWAAVRHADGVDEAALNAAIHGAYLPPDRQPLEVHRALHGSPEAVRALARLGLFDLDLDGDEHVARLHRLFGGAIRADLEHGRHAAARDAAVLRIATDEAATALLDDHGDLRTVLNLDDELTRLDRATATPDHALGVAMHGVARLLELHGHTRQSGERYTLAERHLQDDAALLALGRLGRARTVNQQHPRDEPRLREALAWVTEAEAVLAATDEPGRADRCLAMQGLLRQKLAQFPQAGETKLDLLKEALGVIEEAHRRRTARLDPRDPELARSHFNLAGVRIRLAQEEPVRARFHLQHAWDVYTAVEDTRRDIYGRDRHPHIAACVVGRGYVDYYRALLLPASRSERSRQLRAATEAAMDALRMRETQDGSTDQDEVVKVTRFLAKVALARDAAPTAAAAPSAEQFDKQFGGRVRTAHGEIAAARLVLASIPDLPAVPADAAAAADEWLRSRPLAELASEYGGVPPYDRDLTELLAWFEEFSLRWDTRQGQERNLVTVEQPPEPLAGQVRQAALALGMVGTTPPPSDTYDHVLILGGLVRACLARPLYAAQLLRDGGLRARSVTALGAFRPLRGDELALAQRFGHGELADEFDAMHAGVRAAFKLGAPASERVERSEVDGASSGIVEYATPTPVRVVGAPSTEPGKRANTADTYKWFAEHVAELRAGERVLLVTSDIYVRFQHADALRMLALPYGVEVEAVGIQPGDADPRLAQEFTPLNYLQEIRSTIRALRALDAAFTAR